MTRITIKIILLVISINLLFWAQAASAQSKDTKAGELVNLGNGIFLEVVPPEYMTFLGETPEYYKNSEEWVIIPATYETITKTIIIQEGYSELQVIPASIADDGSRLEPAKASLVEVPAITKAETHRVVRTPSRAVKRTIPNLYHPSTRRKKVSDAIYIFRDGSGIEVARYDDPLFAMRFIERLPN